LSLFLPSSSRSRPRSRPSPTRALHYFVHHDAALPQDHKDVRARPRLRRPRAHPPAPTSGHDDSKPPPRQEPELALLAAARLSSMTPTTPTAGWRVSVASLQQRVPFSIAGTHPDLPLRPSVFQAPRRRSSPGVFVPYRSTSLHRQDPSLVRLTRCTSVPSQHRNRSLVLFSWSFVSLLARDKILNLFLSVLSYCMMAALLSAQPRLPGSLFAFPDISGLFSRSVSPAHSSASAAPRCSRLGRLLGSRFCSPHPKLHELVPLRPSGNEARRRFMPLRPLRAWPLAWKPSTAVCLHP
jgi:hypothetical protein